MIEASDLESHGPGSSSWRESAVEFISARVELLHLEAREAGKSAAKRGVMVGLIAGCAMTAWMTLVAGIIGWIATAGNGVPWHFVAIGVAIFHLLIAGLIVFLLRKPSSPSFPLTKLELSKDREWILNLKDRPKP